MFLQNPKVLSNRSVPWQNHHELYAAHRRANGIVATDPARPASLSKGVGAQKQTQLTASAEAAQTVLYGIGDQLGPGMVNHELQRTAGPDRFRGAGQAGNAVGDRMSIERARGLSGGGAVRARTSIDKKAPSMQLLEQAKSRIEQLIEAAVRT